MIVNPNAPAPLATAPAPLPVAPAPLSVAPAPVATAAAPTSPETPAAKGRFGPRIAEVAPEFYSLGHVKFLALPADVRAKCKESTRERIRKGLSPSGEAVMTGAEHGIEVKDWKTTSNVPTPGEGAPRRRGLLDGSPIAAKLAAKLGEVSWAKLAELLSVSVPEARSIMAQETTPRVHVAERLAAEFGVHVTEWRCTPEGAAALAKRIEDRRAADKAKREAETKPQA